MLTAAKKSATILIVEDEAIVAMDLTEQLQELGYEVCATVDNGLSALEHAENHRPHLILMDILIKGDMDGIETAKMIGQQFKIPIIFLTSFNDIHTVERATEAAPYGYLTKPFQPKELRATLEVALYKGVLEQKLRASEYWFSSVLRCVTDGVIATNVEQTIEYVNATAEAILGLSSEDLKGQKINEVLVLEDIETGLTSHFPLMSVLEENKIVSIPNDVFLVADHARKNPIDISAAPIRSEEGGAMGIVIAFRDVSDRRRIERLKEEFISTVSHELRTPLTAIRGALGMMASGALGTLPPELSSLLNMALHNSDRLGKLIEDLLDFERITGNYIHFDMQEHALMPLIEQAIESCLEHGVDIRILERVDTLRLPLDSKRFIQALSNLIDNAAKFSDAGQSVYIKAFHQDNAIRIAVIDQGPGIPQHFHDQIFKTFAQADASDTRQRGGVGLSLSITKDLIEKMGGTVGFESQEGHGATFYFEFLTNEVL